MRKQKVTIKIPKELYLKLKKLVKNTGFSSVTEFIVFTLRVLVSGGKIEKHEKKEIKEIKKRLKKLGYL